MRYKLATSLLALAAASQAAPAFAQDQAAPNPEASQDFGEIIVTAQFREQNLQDTPIAITAMSGDVLAARGQTNVADISAQAPGLNLQPMQGSFGPSLAASIRGVGQFDYNPAVEPGVGFYIDDVYYPSLTGAMFDLLDLDRIEILRGPQGTLSGRNSIGGSLKIYSKKPQGDNSGSVHAAYGSRNRLDLRGSVDLGLGQSWSLRLSGAAKRQDGYVKVYDFGCVNPPGSALNPAVGGVAPLRPSGSCLVDKDSDVSYQAVRGQLRFNPSDAIDINIAADYSHDEHRIVGTVLTYVSPTPSTNPAIRGEAYNTPFDSRFICGPYCNYETGIMPADSANGVLFDTSRPLTSTYKGGGISGHADFALSDNLKLTSITGYREFRSQFAADADLSPLPVTGSSVDMKVNFFSQEVRLNGSLMNDAITYTLGGYYSHQKSDLENVNDLRVSGLQFASLGDMVPAKTLAFFGHVSWEIVHNLTFNGGIRRTHEEKDYTFSRRYADGTPGVPRLAPLDGLTGSYSDSRWDYRANLQYEWTPDIMTYVQYSTGFKGGGISPRPFFASQVQPFNPETIKAYEVGLKSELFDRMLRLNLSAYYNKFTDIQLFLRSCPQFTPNNAPAPCAMTANAGNADVKGFEAEAVLRPVDGFQIEGSLSHIDFEYTSILAAASTGPSGVRLSDTAPYSSRWKWSIGAQYEADLPGGSTITPRVDASYQSSFYSEPRNAPTNYVPGYTVVNGSIRWQSADRDLAIALQVTNILDNYYLTNVFDQSIAAGFATGQPARPREWAVSVTKRF